MIAITALRYLVAQAFITASRIPSLTEKTRIQAKSVTFKQVDRESHWDDYIILQVWVMTLVHWILPGFGNFPLNDWWGLGVMLALHAGPTEFIYYWFHRALHHHSLYRRYHSHHHASFVTEPITGTVHPFMEHVGYTANFAIPLLGTWYFGGASLAMFYIYLIGFDVLNAIGHCNFEIFPPWIFKALPPLKYMLYTPSFHSLHHSHVHTNFCLFMPIYDHMYGTVDAVTDKVFDTASAGVEVKNPDMVFLAHGTELLSVFHLPFMFANFASKPFDTYTTNKLWMWLLWPLALLTIIPLQLINTTFCASNYLVGGRKIATWVVPRFGFQYFIQSQQKKINVLIEKAILDADKQGVQVFGLGALNKAEYINAGGKLFVDKLGKDLKTVKVVHGNTLTAACILNELAEYHGLIDFGSIKAKPYKGKKQVLLTGSTSKLGRAITLYLARCGVEVLMQTTSEERYQAIRAQCDEENRHLLRRVDTCEAGKDCKIWIIGRPCPDAEQRLASPGTVFHQFVVPQVQELRADCKYGKLASMALPKKATGVKTCEMTMERGHVHACHAGALVHTLEEWQHHEVGMIDVDRIDTVWEAAIKHGLRPAIAQP